MNFPFSGSRGAGGNGLKPLRETYASKDAYLRDIPRLIIKHNLHGIDIDPRAVQIAGLSLWLRAQRTWQQQKLRPQDRPTISRSNIVCAEPMPGEKAFLDEFIAAHLANTAEEKLLGQLLRRVFDAMQLAGEAGSLLKIEEEIAGAVAEAKAKWRIPRKPEQFDVFADEIPLPVQQELEFDVLGITDEAFWEQAEERIYAALQAYAEQAEQSGGYQRRLFVNDAAKGFAFIDLCRQRYDVVVMNPPFGAISKRLQKFLEEHGYHNRDIASDFVTNSVRMGATNGMIGAITTRTIFFLKGFLDWRDWLVDRLGGPHCFLDIGFGVLDAAVEASAFTLQLTGHTAFGSYRKALGLHEQFEASGPITFAQCPEFLIQAQSFKKIPRHPFAYWASDKVLEAFAKLPSIDNKFTVLSGGNPRDDFRFIRHWVETPTLCCRDYVPYSKGGEFALYYHDVHLELQWKDEGRELKVHAADYRQSLGWSPDWRALMMNYDQYFSPAITWPRRTSRLSFRFLPKGCVFGDKSPVIITQDGTLDPLRSLIGYLNTSSFKEALNLMVGSSELAQSFEVGIVKSCPFPRVDTIRLTDNVNKIFCYLYLLDSVNESSHAFLYFCAPSLVRNSVKSTFSSLNTLHYQYKQQILEIQSQLEQMSSLALCVDIGEPQMMATDLKMPNVHEMTESLLSNVLGIIFGRWDIHFATGEKPEPELPDPFDPLPACPPGQLQNEQGLPITQEDVARLKEEGQWDYAIEIPWAGILVDDPGHALDIETRIHSVLKIIWKDRWDAIERESSEILGVSTLRDYFRKPTGFFADHIKRYSKSRRKAPIYWQLSTPSASYSVWLYYHRFTRDTFFQVLDLVNNKLEHESGKLRDLQQEAGPNPGSDQRKAIANQQTFVEELSGFRDEVARIAPLWNPNLNDGVIINFAPLWRLVPQNANWQKECKAVWDKLVDGEYDWAHLALHLWPERVTLKCQQNRSLAIAHDLEKAFWAEYDKGKWQPVPVDDATVQGIIEQRTSPAVEAALQALLAAPIARGKGKTGRSGKAGRRQK